MDTINNTRVKYLYELNELENIMDSLIFEDEVIPNIFDETNALELIESALYIMEDYMNENPTAISEPDFEEEFLEDVKELFYLQFEDDILENDWVEHDLDDLLEEAFKIFITTFYPERSISNNNIMFTENESHCGCEKYNETQIDKNIQNQIILNKIEHIKQKPQPTQRTDEWYKFRHNLITASNAYKAFESQSTINQLIYEKCQPLKKNDANTNTNTVTVPTMVNINTPFHWGQKYEPLSVMLYEYLYNTTVADFGCIKHDNYHFLGASPDGINVDINTERFGRMLEIKNIVNREINGIPKKEYWIQMQLQMEVCDLDECDFLETKFVEYQTSNEFFKELEVELQPEPGQEKNVKALDKKGVVIYFHNISEAKPFYLYKPLNIVKIDEILKWEEEMIELYQTPQHNMTYIKSNYWKLEKLSCVLVLRNKNWFKNNIQAIENVWNIIEKERITGYEHRAPNRKNKIKKDYVGDNNHGGLCLIKLQN
jgi:putative phage-type endonuclease